MNHANFKRHASYSPGGRNCPCCGPAPKERKREDRRVRRREKHFAMREVQQEIQSMELPA